MKPVLSQFHESLSIQEGRFGPHHSEVAGVDVYWIEGGSPANPTYTAKPRGFEMYVSHKKPSGVHTWWVATNPEQDFGKTFVGAKELGQGDAKSADEAKRQAEEVFAQHVQGQTEAFDRKAIVTTAADVFKTIGNTGKIAFTDLMKTAKQKGYHVGADTDDKVRAFAKELANELSAAKGVKIEGEDEFMMTAYKTPTPEQLDAAIQAAMDNLHRGSVTKPTPEEIAKAAAFELLPLIGDNSEDNIELYARDILKHIGSPNEGMNDIGDTPKIHLQGIGKVAARPASSIRPGDILLFNYGYPSKVLTADQEGKWVVFKLQYIRDNDGKEYSMKKKLDTLVGVQDSSPDDRHVQPTEAEEYIKCPECMGTGETPNNWADCAVCKGGGKVKAPAKAESSRYHVMQDENDGKFYVVATVNAKTVSSGYKSRKDAEAHLRDLDKSEGMGADTATYICPDCKKASVHADSQGWRDCDSCGWKETNSTDLAKAKKTEGEDCQTCKGSGQVSSPAGRVKPCPDCHGLGGKEEADKKQVKCPTCGAAAINIGQAPEGKFGRTVYKCSKCVGSWDIANTKPTSWKDQYKDEADKVYPVQRGQGASDESYANYGWMIDRDLVADPKAKAPSNSNAKGMIGPRDISPEVVKRLEAGEGEEFRMLDGDQEVYYYGRLIVVDDEAGDGEEDFAPMEDFGTPNAGAAEIQYKTNGVWKTI